MNRKARPVSQRGCLGSRIIGHCLFYDFQTFTNANPVFILKEAWS